MHLHWPNSNPTQHVSTRATEFNKSHMDCCVRPSNYNCWRPSDAHATHRHAGAIVLQAQHGGQACCRPPAVPDIHIPAIRFRPPLKMDHQCIRIQRVWSPFRQTYAASYVSSPGTELLHDRCHLVGYQAGSFPMQIANAETENYLLITLTT